MREKPDYYYRQSGVIPFRVRSGQLQVLLISSRKRRRWVVPKGVIEPWLSAADSAVKEALEEAGIEGRVSPFPLGIYRYDKWGGSCTVELFVMEVNREHERWEEEFREREWMSVAQAAGRVQEDDLRRLIAGLPDYLNTGGRSSS